MKTIDITGKNYCGRWSSVRTACRAVIIRDGSILLSHETVTDLWSLPGGGLEEGEDERACCRREVSEETGLLVEPSGCFLEINEYYGHSKFVSRYFLCGITGVSAMKLTVREAAAGMKPEWLPVNEALSLFSSHEKYDGTDEERRGIYLREYTALSGLV